MFEDKRISFLPEEMKKKEAEALAKVKIEKEKINLTHPAKPFIIPQEKKESHFLNSIKIFFRNLFQKKEKEIKEEKIILKENKNQMEIPKPKLTPNHVGFGVTPNPMRFGVKNQKTTLAEAQKEKLEVPKQMGAYEPLVKVSLLPHEMAVKFTHSSRPQVYKFLAIVLTVCILVVVLCFLGLKIDQNVLDKKVISLEQSIETKNQEIAQLANIQNEVKELEQRVENAQALLNSHVYWTKFFALLEQSTLPQIHYSGLNVDAAQKFTLKTTAPDYPTAAKQLVIFQNNAQLFKSANISGLKLNTQGNELDFNFDLVLENNLLKF